ncbi:TonB-dependent receptor [Sphingobium boeckii]|uniref:Outer membrane receptor protein involved in Fe transport n=1 Tax=Sphingobium boeckii TaxID=1082345 RepID=A0A7W9AFN7_9SPHN|nr:TonB-dependent receptor [Sphingobium boeckii]MBB5684718.1 outer membrane receptor protein involved in Fe transport [Sphingobium boeckii]
MSRRAKLKLGLLSATIFTNMVAMTPAMAEAPVEAEAEGDSIIVTGTRRITTIMDSPINISAVSAEDMARQRIQDVRDLADFTPGLTISDTGPGTTGTVVLRGLSASDVDSSGSNYDDSVGVYLGEVPLYYDFKLLDIERVETLLGPQGTLYGLGTLAGAIRYIPNRPDVEKFEGEVHGSFYGKSHGSKPGYQMDAVINIPIAKDHIAFRSATGYYYDPGFIDYTLLIQEPGVSLPQPAGSTTISDSFRAANLTSRKDLNFEKTITTRNQLLFQVDEDFSATVTYAFQQTKTDGAQSNGAGVFGTGKYENASRYIEPVKRRAHLVSLEINANVFNIADLVATTAYTDVKSDSQGDNTDLLLDLDYDYELFPAFSSWSESHTRRKQYNQEVRLVSSHGGPFSWSIGGFYNENKYGSDYAEHIPNHPWADAATNPDYLEYVSYTRSKVTEQAIFGEGSFHITPDWQVTGGARYFKYTSTIAGAQTLPILGDPLDPRDLTPRGGDAGKNGTVWKINSSYKFTDGLMAYATYSKGYRIGGPNSVAPCPTPLPNDPDGDNINNTQLICALPNEIQFGPDSTKNIEIGIRSQLFDRKLSFSFNVFQIKWQGLQVDSATLNGIAGITVNGGGAESKGFESSFQLRPLAGLSIQGTYSYTDAKLTDDVPGIIPVNDPPGTYPSAPITLAALSGDRLPGSTKNSGSLGAAYTMPLMAGSLTANWTATYRGSVVTRLGWDRAYGDKLPSFVMHRASLSYDAGQYSVSLFANNIFDKYAVVSVSNDRSRTGLNDGVLLRYYQKAVANPRTFGVDVRFKY